jgi:hypothetical protein
MTIEQGFCNLPGEILVSTLISCFSTHSTLFSEHARGTFRDTFTLLVSRFDMCANSVGKKPRLQNLWLKSPFILLVLCLCICLSTASCDGKEGKHGDLVKLPVTKFDMSANSVVKKLDTQKLW